MNNDELIYRQNNIDYDDDSFDTENIIDYDIKEGDQITDLQMLLDDDLLFENIKEQIENPINCSKTNNIEIFENRIKFLKVKYSEDIDFIGQVNKISCEFFDRVLKEIFNIYPFSCTESIDDEKKNTIVSLLYNFFILKYKDNIEIFLVNYILENKKSLVSAYDPKKKNVETIAMKKVFKNRDEAVILANCRKVIRDITGMELDDKYIISTIIKDDPMLLSNFMINSFIIEKQSIMFECNFSEVFFRPINEKYEDYSQVIISVTQKLFNIFSMK